RPTRHVPATPSAPSASPDLSKPFAPGRDEPVPAPVLDHVLAVLPARLEVLLENVAEVVAPDDVGRRQIGLEQLGGVRPCLLSVTRADSVEPNDEHPHHADRDWDQG